SHHNATTNLKDLSNKFSKVQINTKSAVRRFSAKSFSIDQLIESLKNGKYKRIVTLVGAGISTPSGIPDFRTPGTGLYDNLQRYNIPYPEAIFELNYFYRNPKPFFDLAKELYPGKYFPNLIHYFIRYLYDQNLLHRVYTQNIDGLERIAGIPPEKIVEAHGSFMSATCQRCRQKYEGEDIRQQIFDDQIPKCTRTSRCSGIIKPDIVFFGEDLPRRFQLYVQDLPSCDCCIVMGTSLAVYPFADIVDSTTRSTTRLLINRQIVGTFLAPRPYDVTLIGDLEINVKEFLIKLDVFDKVMELMKRENEKFQNNKKYHNAIKSTTTVNGRLKTAETFIEQKRKFSTINYYRQEPQTIFQSKVLFNEETKAIIEKYNDALLFNRRRSKSTLPVLVSKPSLSSASSSSSSDSLNSSLSESELMLYAFKRPSDAKARSVRQIIPTSITKVKKNPLPNATLRIAL
ncbi:unnamed protein product, partial [Rotaria magnacalcarata]